LCKPEFVTNSFKSCAARKLRETNQISGDVKPWTRHVWTEEQVSEAIEYVMFGQGDEPLQ